MKKNIPLCLLALTGVGACSSAAEESGAPAENDSRDHEVTGDGGGQVSSGGSPSSGSGGATPSNAGGNDSSGGAPTSASGGSDPMAATGGTSNGTSSGPCDDLDFTFCEDFEEGDAGALPPGWEYQSGWEGSSEADVGISTDEVRSGAGALLSASGQRGASRSRHSLTALGETAYKHWGRIYYRVGDNSPAPSRYFHVTWVALSGPEGENRVVDVVQAPNETHQWLFNVPDDSCCTSSSYDWSFDSDWHCAEWYVDADEKEYQFFLDGSEVPISFTGRGDAPMSHYDEIRVGGRFYQPSDTISEPFGVWFDDLAIDDERIGCDP